MNRPRSSLKAASVKKLLFPETIFGTIEPSGKIFKDLNLNSLTKTDVIIKDLLTWINVTIILSNSIFTHIDSTTLKSNLYNCLFKATVSFLDSGVTSTLCHPQQIIRLIIRFMTHEISS